MLRQNVIFALAAVVLLHGISPQSSFAEPAELPQMQVWYRGEAGFPAPGIMVANWEDQATAAGQNKRSLSRSQGNPQTVLIQTPMGPKRVLHLDGKSTLSCRAGNWGTFDADRSIVVLAKLQAGSTGFLFDGATNSGMSRAQVRDGHWYVGGQPGPIANVAKLDSRTLPAVPSVWQVHGFVFHPEADGTMTVSHWIDASEEAVVQNEAAVPHSGLVLGGNAQGEMPLAVDIAELQVYSCAMTHAQFQRVVENLKGRWGTLEELPAGQQFQSPLRDENIFRKVLRQQGDDGVRSYRIPGLATTRSGALLSVFDIRHDSTGDLPANIDVGLMRSTDNGQTWSGMQTIMDFDQSVPDSLGNGVGDPAILADRETGEVFVAAVWSQGDRGWKNSGPGLEPAETAQLVLTRSRDDGLTWSAPINITKQTKQKDWKIFFQGPGAGIQLRNGTLVFAAQFRAPEGEPHSCLLWSSDHGESWHVTEPAVPETPHSSESQVAELSDGSLLLTMRNERRSGQRLWARYQWKDSLADGGWTTSWFDLPDPTCMAGLVRHPSGALIFTNPNSSSRRIGLTARISDDDGKTWSAGRLIDPRFCSYSCLTILKNGEIGLLYECGDETAIDTLTFARFSLDWIRDAATEKSALLSPAPVFSDHMVLQAETTVPVWGTSQPGQRIEVRFGDQQHTTVSDPNGRWEVKLRPMPPSFVPQNLIIHAGSSSDANEIVYSDVLVGDVWLAAGQSNMDFPTGKAEERQALIKAATNSGIRLLQRKGQSSANIVYSPGAISRLNPETYFAGKWQVASADQVEDFSAVAWSFAKEVASELDRPLGIIDVSIGGTPAEAWIPVAALRNHPRLHVLTDGNWLENPAADEWCRTRAKRNLSAAIQSSEPLPGNELGPFHCYQPGFLWNAGVAPLVPFPVRGFLWYQGESNATSPERVAQHRDLFPLLVESWRTAWGQQFLPFLYVQLTGINRPDWPEFRDQQRKFLDEIPETGMAITIDLGHPTDVHPRSKAPVGHRLALLALNGTTTVPKQATGPLVTSVTSTQAGCRVGFRCSDGLTSIDNSALTGFELAGSDGIFHPAEAVIKGSEVLVTSSKVPSPRSIRYGWSPFPDPPLNLINSEKIPASPFQLDVN